MTKCIIYVRISTSLQDTRSQVEDLRNFAKYSNFQIIKEFEEVASGYDVKADRTVYLEMKEFAIKNNIPTILCWELSRFGRNTLHTLSEIENLKKHNIDVFFKKENIHTNSDDATSKLLLQILSSIAELERNSIVDRTSRGISSSIMQGKKTGLGIMPYGYTGDEYGYLKIDEKEAVIVRDVFNMYNNGIALKRIAIIMNSKNIPTRYTKLGKTRILQSGKSFKIVWRNNSLQKMLQNSIYKGERHYKDNIINVPQIIDTEIWDSVQNRFKSHIGYSIRTKYPYLFKTKLKCGHCGYMIQGRTETRYGIPKSFYYCNGRADLVVKCKTGQFTSPMLDDVLYTSLFKFSVSTETYKYFKDDLVKSIDLDEKYKQLAYFKGELDVILAKKKRVNNMYKDGYITEIEYKKEHSTLRSETLEMENNIKSINNFITKYKDVNIFDILKAGKDETDFNTQYEYVQKYVDRVDVYNVINYNSDEIKKYGKKWAKANINRTSNVCDKIWYLELYSFNNTNPIKIFVTSWTNLWYAEYYHGWISRITFDKVSGTLSFKK